MHVVDASQMWSAGRVLLISLGAAAAAPLARNYVYAHFLRDGIAPTWADFYRDLELESREETEAVLEKLADDHDIVLLPHTNGGRSTSYMLMAHPFSNLPTCHSASHESGAVVLALSKLVSAVPFLTPRLFMRTPRPWLYGN